MLAKHNVRTDKGFGQHFLISERVVGAIVHAASEFDGVLEVGPGPGVLTKWLALQSEVKAIEVDHRILGVLADYSPGISVLNCDALAVDWRDELLALPSPVGIVSNMPYNISGPLLEKVSQSSDLIAGAVLMMQREVADKIRAKVGDRKRGSLSVNLQMVFDIEFVCAASGGCFLPPPKVESCVLKFVPRSDSVEPSIRTKIEKIVRHGFRMPRKTLANNLKGIVDIEGLGFKDSVRPHELTESEWMKVYARAQE